ANDLPARAQAHRRSESMSEQESGESDVSAGHAKRQVAFRAGLSAESRAAAFLVAKGFRILARRWKSPVGEIDIAARRRRLLVFVEVKARDNFDDAAWSVTPRQKKALSDHRTIFSVSHLCHR